MSKDKDSLPKSDLSECNEKIIGSNLEDDTEDYIQPSQPLGFPNPCLESISKKNSADNDTKEISISTIDETLPFPKSMMSTPFGDVSRNFIPESENPVKRKIDVSDKEEIYKKRLNLDESCLIKETPDMFSTQSQMNDTADSSHFTIPPTPAKSSLTNVSLSKSPQKINETLESEHSYTMFSDGENRGIREETATEDASVNDESNNFFTSKTWKSEISELQDDRKENHQEAENTPSDVIVLNSSKFMDDSGMESLLRSGKTSVVSEVKNKLESEETQLDDTVDAEDICYSPYSVEKSNASEGINEKSIQPVTETLFSSVERDSESKSNKVDVKTEVLKLKGALKNISDDELARLQKHSTPENPLSKSPKINESASSIENGTPPVQENLNKSTDINFTVYLQLDCQLVMDPHSGEPVTKKIINVKELVKRQPKNIFLETNCESSYKTKIFSSSSSGSVYSDKTGLPYPLPSRSLPTSINSSSSSVDLAKHMKIIERQVWINEYKIPMVMDEILPRYMEQHKMIFETNKSKPITKRKMSIRLRKKKDWSQPLDNVLESSVTEQSSSENNSDDLLHDLDKSNSSKSKENSAEDATKKEQDEKEIVKKVEDDLQKNIPQPSTESVDGIISQGLLVFARWTDKRYYPGIVLAKAKYDRWEVKFDDDTEKVIREDLILPLNWLTKGELVFALAAEKYASGKIIEIIRDEEVKFKIELDETNEEIIVRKCDICLNDVMAGIIREKFKPSNKLNPILKSCDIDVDNVLTGKRIREQRTPIRGVTSILQSDSSTSKKRKGNNLSETGDKSKTPMKNPTSLAKEELNSEKKTRSSRKKVAKQLLPEIEQPKVEEIPSPDEEMSIESHSKSDGNKKKSRILKYDSDNGKMEKSENLTINETHQSSAIKKRSKNSSKVVIFQSKDKTAIDEKAETRKKDRFEKKIIQKKSGKNEKKKGEIAESNISTRQRKSKSYIVKSEVKKKRKN